MLIRRLRWKRVLVLTMAIVLISFLISAFGYRSSSNEEKPVNIQTDQSRSVNDAYTIVLDAGHGGYDSGNVTEDGVLEKDLTLAITMDVGKQLTTNGCHVIYTRTSDDVEWESDNVIDLQSRVDIAIRAHADYFVSLHLNASDEREEARGFETHIDMEQADSLQMAEHIHNQLSFLNYSMDRGMKDAYESLLYVICQNPVPALLLEMGFMSNKEDLQYIQEHCDDLAEAIGDGILTALKERAAA